MAKCGIKMVEGIKHEDELGFPNSYVYCKCGWKSRPYSSDSANRPSIVGRAIAEYIDHRIGELGED